MFDQLRPLSAADASLYPTEIPWKLSPISTQFYCNFYSNYHFSRQTLLRQASMWFFCKFCWVFSSL